MRNRAAVAARRAVLIALACVVGPLLLPNGFDSTDWDAMSCRPRWQNMHCSAPTSSGRDLLVRCLVGGRISLMVGAARRRWPR